MTTVALASAERGEFCSEHGGQLQLPRGFSKAHYSVEPIAVGEGKRLQAKCTGMLGKLLGRRGSCQKRKMRLAVQFAITLFTMKTHSWEFSEHMFV